MRILSWNPGLKKTFYVFWCKIHINFLRSKAEVICCENILFLEIFGMVFPSLYRILSVYATHSARLSVSLFRVWIRNKRVSAEILCSGFIAFSWSYVRYYRETVLYQYAKAVGKSLLLNYHIVLSCILSVSVLFCYYWFFVLGTERRHRQPKKFFVQGGTFWPARVFSKCKTPTVHRYIPKRENYHYI